MYDVYTPVERPGEIHPGMGAGGTSYAHPLMGGLTVPVLDLRIFSIEKTPETNFCGPVGVIRHRNWIPRPRKPPTQNSRLQGWPNPDFRGFCVGIISTRRGVGIISTERPEIALKGVAPLAQLDLTLAGGRIRFWSFLKTIGAARAWAIPVFGPCPPIFDFFQKMTSTWVPGAFIF